tara:strand:+ start:991 stop:1422 length:432 start_codon:yes stop_codon:yes gene_type:complete
MACAGVVASAGAQIDFTLISVRDRTFTVGKTTHTAHGHSSSQSGSSLSKTALEFADGSSDTCDTIEYTTLSALSFARPDHPSSRGDAFRRLVLTGSSGTINSHLLTDAHTFTTTTIQWSVTSSNAQAITESNDNVCIMELRAD